MSIHLPSRLPGSGNLFEVRNLALAFRRRWLLFSVLAASTLFAVLAVTLLISPTWTSTTQIKIEPDPHAATDLQAISNNQPPDQARVDTEVALMRSRDVARMVVKNFRLQTDPEFGGNRDTGAVALERATEALMQRTDVSRLALTYLVDLKVRSKEPGKAAALANAIAGEYLKASVLARVGTATGDTQFLNQQLNALGAKVRAADARAARYRSSVGIVEGAKNGTITEQQIAPLASQLATAEAAAASANARLAAAEGQIRLGGIESVSGVLNSTVVADLRRQRAEVLGKQSDATARYGQKYPDTIALQEQLDGLDRQLHDAALRTVEGIRSDAKAANAAAGNLRRRISSLHAEQSRESRAGVAAEAYDRDADAKRTFYNQTAQRAQQLSQQRQNTEATARIVSRAEPPLRPSFPNRPLFALLGLFLGLCCGSVGVMVAEKLDVTLRTPADVEQCIGAPYVGSMPRFLKGQLEGVGIGSMADDLVAPEAEITENLRSIRRSLRPTPETNVLAVCSSLPGEGKSTFALSLARVMAMDGNRVVLIDCDLRRGVLAAIAGIELQNGLVELLDGKAALESVLVGDPSTTMWILPIAKHDFTSRDLFGRIEMTRLLETLRGQFDQVILDTPALLAGTDARTLAALADITIMLVRWKSTSKLAVQEARRRLRQDNTTITGVALTMVEKGDKLSRFDRTYSSEAYFAYYPGK